MPEKQTSRRLPSPMGAKPKPTWSLARPFSSVGIDLSNKAEVQDVIFLLFTHPKGLKRSEVAGILSKPWPITRWNLLSVVLQTLFLDHPDVPEILRKIEEKGGFPWKSDPF